MLTSISCLKIVLFSQTLDNSNNGGQTHSLEYKNKTLEFQIL